MPRILNFLRRGGGTSGGSGHGPGLPAKVVIPVAGIAAGALAYAIAGQPSCGRQAPPPAPPQRVVERAPQLGYPFRAPATFMGDTDRGLHNHNGIGAPLRPEAYWAEFVIPEEFRARYKQGTGVDAPKLVRCYGDRDRVHRRIDMMDRGDQIMVTQGGQTKQMVVEFVNEKGETEIGNYPVLEVPCGDVDAFSRYVHGRLFYWDSHPLVDGHGNRGKTLVQYGFLDLETGLPWEGRWEMTAEEAANLGRAARASKIGGYEAAKRRFYTGGSKGAGELNTEKVRREGAKGIYTRDLTGSGVRIDPPDGSLF